MRDELKRLVWMGASRRDLKAFPRQVMRDVGQALCVAQRGQTHPAAKPLKGFGGRSVLEIVALYQTDTYRAVYTVRFADTQTPFMLSRRNPKEVSQHRRRS